MGYGRLFIDQRRPGSKKEFATRLTEAARGAHVVVQDVHVRVQRELATADSPVSTVGDVAMGLEVTFLNSAVDSVGKLA